jgi:hypothetical protein
MNRFALAAITAALFVVAAPAAFASGVAFFAPAAAHFDPMGLLSAALASLLVAAYLLPRSFRGVFGGLAVLVLCSIVCDVAFAADASAPETVAQATGETTKVTWAYGAIIQQWATALGSLIFAAVMFALRQLPAQIYAIIVSMRADQLLQKAIDYGVNAVEGATKDKTLNVDLGNKVLAQAVQYVLDNAPGWLQAWMGGPDQIVKKIFARLNLDPAASAPNTTTVLAQAAAPST